MCRDIAAERDDYLRSVTTALWAVYRDVPIRLAVSHAFTERQGVPGVQELDYVRPEAGIPQFAVEVQASWCIVITPNLITPPPKCVPIISCAECPHCNRLAYKTVPEGSSVFRVIGSTYLPCGGIKLFTWRFC